MWGRCVERGSDDENGECGGERRVLGVSSAGMDGSRGMMMGWEWGTGEVGWGRFVEWGKGERAREMCSRFDGCQYISISYGRLSELRGVITYIQIQSLLCVNYHGVRPFQRSSQKWLTIVITRLFPGYRAYTRGIVACHSHYSYANYYTAKLHLICWRCAELYLHCGRFHVHYWWISYIMTNMCRCLYHR